jgi:hypothetical protein
MGLMGITAAFPIPQSREHWGLVGGWGGVGGVGGSRPGALLDRLSYAPQQASPNRVLRR